MSFKAQIIVVTIFVFCSALIATWLLITGRKKIFEETIKDAKLKPIEAVHFGVIILATIGFFAFGFVFGYVSINYDNLDISPNYKTENIAYFGNTSINKRIPINKANEKFATMLKIDKNFLEKSFTPRKTFTSNKTITATKIMSRAVPTDII